MNPQISVGMHVAFDSEYGPQTGTVTALFPSCEHGQRYAVIEIDHDLSGIVWMMPLEKIEATLLPCPAGLVQPGTNSAVEVW